MQRSLPMIRTLLVSSALSVSVATIAQFSNDAAIVDYVGLKYPCAGQVTPTLRIQNQGTSSMATCVVETWKNGVFNNSFNWILATPAATGVTRQPSLPVITGVMPGDELEFRIISVNTITDQDATDNIRVEPIDGSSELSPSYEVKVQVFTDGDPQETTWSILDAAGLPVASGGPYATINALEETMVTLSANDCYSFKLLDSGGNGMDQRALNLPGHVKVLGLGTEVISVPGASFSDAFEDGLRTGGSAWGANNAALAAVTYPVGSICGTQFQPVVMLVNAGSAVLNSVEVEVKVDNVVQYTTTLSTLGLASLASTTVALPLVNSSGAHVITMTARLPNGAVDSDPLDDVATSNYSTDGQVVKVVLKTDNNPSDNAWIIYDASNMTVASSLPYILPNTTTVTTHCLPAGGRYAFTLSDATGDGVNAGSAGHWQLQDALGRPIIGDDGVMSSRSPALLPSTTGYSDHEFQLPLGPSKPWSSAPYMVCGNYALGVQSKIRCTTVSGVSSYQWEFSDPNKGYRRRISSNLNYIHWTNFGSAPPQMGVRYFVRNRADQGLAGFSDDNWGEGCEMAWSNTTPFCTSLINTPGSTLSCNVTRTWGGASKLWAQPVVGALPYDGDANGVFTDPGDQAFAYHFRITGPGGYVKDAWTTSYILQLNWATLPMNVPGTYQVKVEVQVGGVWRGFCGPSCPVTIAAGPAQLAVRSAGVGEEVSEGVLQVWPNPVTDGRIHLQFDGLAAYAGSVSVDLFDATGRRVFGRREAVNGSSYRGAIELDGSLAEGVYVVRASAGGRVFTQRVLVR